MFQTVQNLAFRISMNRLFSAYSPETESIAKTDQPRFTDQICRTVSSLIASSLIFNNTDVSTFVFRFRVLHFAFKVN